MAKRRNNPNYRYDGLRPSVDIMMRNWILFSLPTHFLLPEKKVSKEIWHKGDSPYVSSFMLARLSPSTSSGLQTLLAKVKKHIEDQSFSLSIAVGEVPIWHLKLEVTICDLIYFNFALYPHVLNKAGSSKKSTRG